MTVQAVLAASDWPGWLALIISGAALAWSVAWSINQQRDSRKHAREIKEIRSAQAQSIEGIERATRSGIDPAAAHALGAAISVWLVRRDVPVLGVPRTRAIAWSTHLFVKNLGPGGAQVRRLEITTPGVENAIDETDPGVPGGLQELFPGEEFNVRLILPENCPEPIEVVVTWLDGTGNERQRARALTFPA